MRWKKRERERVCVYVKNGIYQRSEAAQKNGQKEKKQMLRSKTHLIKFNTGGEKAAAD